MSESGNNSASMNLSTPRGAADEAEAQTNARSNADTKMAEADVSAAASSSAAAASSAASSSAPNAAASSSSSPSSLPVIPESTLKSLDDLLFGPTSNCNAMDVSRWRQQGFVFSTRPRTLFGLVQISGGPCGILAPVQAFILQRLLFGGVGVAINSSGDIPVAPTPAECDDALVWALGTILTRSVADRKGAKYTVISTSGGNHQHLHLHQLNSTDEVFQFWQSHLPQLHSEMGVLPFVYSVLLTRGLDAIRADMDDSSSYLVGQFGHSSQELVNLMLVGQAVTNVFDGNKILGDANDASAFRLKGIPSQNQIGFLTLLEALRYSSVGQYLKSPQVPVWVIGSSNHYTVMFSLDRRVGQQTVAQKKQRQARSAFDVLDPANEGFIPMTSLHALLEKLDASVLPPNITMDEVKRRLDPDGLGIILYDRVVTVLEQWEKLKLNIAAQAALPNTPFSCTACTFDNPAGVPSCQICGTARPPAPAPAAPKPDAEIQNFSLFHFNGIEIPNKSYCECVRVDVSVVEDGLPPNIQGDSISEAQGLKEIILTKWPSCIIDFPSAMPKIS